MFSLRSRKTEETFDLIYNVSIAAKEPFYNLNRAKESICNTQRVRNAILIGFSLYDLVF